ncbi:hypothetical protein AAHC03_020833 [Spirometra sp. Aus1]
MVSQRERQLSCRRLNFLAVSNSRPPLGLGWQRPRVFDRWHNTAHEKRRPGPTRLSAMNQHDRRPPAPCSGKYQEEGVQLPTSLK